MKDFVPRCVSTRSLTSCASQTSRSWNSRCVSCR